MSALAKNAPQLTDAVRAAILVAKTKSKPVNQVIDEVVSTYKVSRTFAIKLIVCNWGSVSVEPQRI